MEIVKIGFISLVGILSGSSYAIFARKHKMTLAESLLGYTGLTLMGILIAIGFVKWWGW